MYPSAPSVRTHADQQTFHDLMAEQLHHAPWLLLSITAHAAALLLLWLLMPVEAKKAPAHAVAVDMAEASQPIEPEKPPEPVPIEEPLQEPTLLPPDAMFDSRPTSDPSAVEAAIDAFPTDPGSSLVGLGASTPIGPGGGGRPRGHGGPPGGGPHATQVENALQWLAAHQDQDGRWDCDQFMKHDVAGVPCTGPGNPVHDIGVTGLALLAFLGDGHSLRQGKYRDTVRRGVVWLREQQDENGRFGPAASSDFVYDHAIAAYAMCEAYGLSQYTTLRPAAQRGLDYLQAHRNPYGAWRYQPRDGDNDTSVTAWCIMAMCSGDFFGLTVDRNALRIATTFLDSCTGPDGHCGYQRLGEACARKPGDHAARFPADRSDALTAAGLFCRFFLGQDPKEQPRMRGAAERLSKRLPRWDTKAGTIDHYYWYYGSYALFQVGGPAWREWSKALSTAVVATQRQDGNALGSWDPVDAWGEDGGRVYSTAILALTLQVHYRYGRLVHAR